MDQREQAMSGQCTARSIGFARHGWLRAFGICLATAVAGFVLAAPPAPAAAATRVALVIGNAAYENVPKLANPVSDSRAIKGSLESLGFDVIYGENLGKRDFEKAIARFAKEAESADVAVVYYSGHGVTLEETPYAVPTDASFASLAEARLDLLPLESMVGELRRVKGVRIAIFDACRDNAAEEALKKAAETRGVVATRGLAPIANPDGLIVAYATQPFRTALDGAGDTHSPFTRALVSHIGTPGLDVKAMLFKVANEVVASTKGTQRPEISISLYQDFSLAAGSPGVAASGILDAAAAARDPDIAACDRVAAHPDDPDRPVGVPGVTYDNLDAKAAVTLCTKALAKAGNIRRLPYELGRAHAKLQNFAESAKLYERAAAGGSGQAMAALGYAYAKGDGVAVDLAIARQWYERAVVSGNAPAMHNLAGMIERGEGGPSDPKRAAELLLRAVRLGLPITLNALVETPELTREDVRRAIQQDLVDQRLLEGEKDGRFGPKTRAALQAIAGIDRSL